MNDYLQILILAVVQGIAEFLPISSSGHLVLAEQAIHHFGGTRSVASGKDVEVILHLGTLLAIVVVYFRDLRRLVEQPRELGLVVLGTLPAAIAGVTLEDWFDRAFDSPQLVGVGLLITAGFLWLAQRMEQTSTVERPVNALIALSVGLFQAIALVPGISRSGSTISGGLLTGLDRLSATRFSFILAVPITAGAIAVTLLKMGMSSTSSQLTVGPALVGILVAFVTGILTLRWLIRMIAQRRLHWFSLYCAVVGIGTLIIFRG